MKTKKLVRIILYLVLLVGMTTSANAALTNFGFETGDSSGWNVNDDSLATVGSYYNYNGTAYTSAGNNFLQLSAGLGADVYTTASQSFAINAGVTITGNAAFISKDYLPYNDYASVRILDTKGNVISTPWHSDVSSVGNYGYGSWYSWSWTAPSDGTYTLAYGVANNGDNSIPSDALFADAPLKTTPVPAAVWLFGSGLAGLAGIRRRTKGHNPLRSRLPTALVALLFPVVLASACWAAPSVTSFAPADGAADVARTATVSANFSESMQPDTMTSGSMVVSRLVGIKKIAAGSRHTVALKNDGTVVAWGDNTYGQRTVPTGLTGVIAVAAGERQTVALKNDGTLVAWGQTYNGTSWGPATVPSGLTGVIAIAAGAYHTVALKSNGTVVAWGYDYNKVTEVPSGLSDVTDITAGYAHSVALKKDGTVVCWGDNTYGQRTVPTGLTGVIAIAAGAYHTMALKSDGTVVAWGSNSDGQTDVPGGLTGVTAVTAGGYRSLALKSDGTVQAWGQENTYDDADFIYYVDETVPAGLTGVSAVAAGEYHTVALKNDGTLVAWGSNNFGQATAPQALIGVTKLATGPYHALALKNDGTVAGWGYNGYGQATVLPGLTGVTDIAAGFVHTLAVKSDGTVAAWGYNNLGATDVPPGLTGVTAVAAGYGHSLALKSDGTLVNWGNDSGNNDVPWYLVPPYGGKVTAIAAGLKHSVALEQNGWVTAWGDNQYGQADGPLGNMFKAIAAGNYLTVALTNDGLVQAWGADSCQVVTAVQWMNPWMSSQKKFIAIAAGASHIVALKSDGTVVAWGCNNTGQTDVPAGLTDVVAISAAGEYSMALKSDGTVVTWGGKGHYFGVTAVSTYSVYDSPVSGSVLYSDTTQSATFAPAAPLESGTYHVAVAGPRNVSAQSLAAQTLWSFAVPSSTPSVTTGTASSISTNSATVTGTVYDNGADTSVQFQYGATTDYGGTVSAGTVPAVAGSTGVAANLTGLSCGSTYHYRVIAANSFGTSTGLDQSFTTGSCFVSSSVANGNGIVSPSGATPVVYGGSITYTVTPAAGYQIVDVKVDGASVGAVTSYTLNNVITTNHTVQAFFAGPPKLSFYASGRITQTDATVFALVNANGASTSTQLQYGVTSAYEHTLSGAELDATWGDHYVLIPIGQLACSSTYHFRFSASNSLGTTVDQDRTFTTTTCIYTVSSSATGNGTISPNGSNQVRIGDSIRYTITPNTGYKIADVTVDGVSVGAVSSYTLTNVTASHTVQASFTPITFTVGSSVVSGSGTITPGGSSLVNIGDSITLLIIPTPGYGIADVTVDGVSVGKQSSYTLYNVTADHTVQASFATIPGITSFTPDNGATDVSPTATISATFSEDMKPETITGGNIAVSRFVRFKQVSTGVDHAIALKSDGTSVAWGANGYGQTSVPAGLSGVTATAAGANNTAALKNDGTVIEWGANWYGQNSVPIGLSGVTAIAAGADHTVALKSDGTLVAWGYNGYGQTSVPDGLSGVSAIAAGVYHTVALKNDGTVAAWGGAWNGQALVPDGLSGVSAIAAGVYYTVALKNDGTVVAWGYNGSGQTSVPVGLSGVTAIATGGSHTVALKNDGTVVAWGDNRYGQTSVPVGLSGVSAIAAGGNHTIALKNDGTLVAWGGSVQEQAFLRADNAYAPVNGSVNYDAATRTATFSPFIILTGGSYRVTVANAQSVTGQTLAAQTAWSFAVPGSAPSAVTGAPGIISLTGATVTGTANDNGADSTALFEYGATTAYGGTVSAGNVLAGADSTPFATNLTGLACGTSYHFRLAASNGAGTTTGLDRTFTTGACQVWTIDSSITSGGGSITPGNSTVTSGDSLTFIISPDTGYRIADVKVDGVTVGAVSSYTLTNVTANHTIQASFTQDGITQAGTTMQSEAAPVPAIGPWGLLVAAAGLGLFLMRKTED